MKTAENAIQDSFDDGSTKSKISLINSDVVWFGLVWFYGVSNIVVYLIPNQVDTDTSNVYDLLT